MPIRIVCFEDNKLHIENLKRSFEGRDVEFLFFNDLKAWEDIEPGQPPPVRVKEIIKFQPDFAIVDLYIQQPKPMVDAGFRIIRKLKELPEKVPGTKEFPVIGWSRFLTDDDRGARLRGKVATYGAIPLLKPKASRYSVGKFLRAAGLG